MINASEADIAWCAGIFEGEGCISITHLGGRAQAVVHLKVHMTDKDVLERLQSILGGHMYGPRIDTRGGGVRKPLWMWNISKWIDVIEAGELLRPWLGERRGAKMDEALALRPAHVRGTPRCSEIPIASDLGYQSHRRLGTPVCDVCRESLALYRRAHYARNRDCLLEKTRAWWAANPDLRRTYNKARWAREKAARLEGQSGTP